VILTGEAELLAKVRYSLLARGVRYDDVDDCAQDVILALLTTRVDVKDQGAYAIGIARHAALEWMAGSIRERLRDDLALIENVTPSREPDALAQLERREKLGLAGAVLRGLPTEQRDILTRFYLQGQKEPEIRQAMSLTPTQFRLGKHRAKATLSARVQRALAAKVAA
jgi:RNA polymerase sigma factor (sigma-70 family)